ncbi:hypothetical protein JYU34_006400 [Plutella xylostella]|uniref:Uncharacterized protein n=1 Tax=Plutella xylostella TaxID=51655 RepID=A0ABQ7QRX1_PLUXY|nr:hypothetical protein JYU34_006400 [Plutella xylostella]
MKLITVHYTGVTGRAGCRLDPYRGFVRGCGERRWLPARPAAGASGRRASRLSTTGVAVAATDVAAGPDGCLDGGLRGAAVVTGSTRSGRHGGGDGRRSGGDGRRGSSDGRRCWARRVSGVADATSRAKSAPWLGLRRGDSGNRGFAFVGVPSLRSESRNHVRKRGTRRFDPFGCLPCGRLR